MSAHELEGLSVSGPMGNGKHMTDKGVPIHAVPIHASHQLLGRVPGNRTEGTEAGKEYQRVSATRTRSSRA